MKALARESRSSRILGLPPRLGIRLWPGAVTLFLVVIHSGTSGFLRAEDYTWTTIAGKAGVIGTNDGPNDIARFNDPSGVALDTAGNLYVSDTLNGTIRKITPVGTNWIVSTLVGRAGVFGSADGTNAGAFFNRPNGIAVDETGRLFIVDHYNDTIRKATPVATDWIVTTLAGLPGVVGAADGLGTNAQFRLPTGLALGTNGSLFVADTVYSTIREVAPAGADWDVTTIAGTADIYGGFADGPDGSASFFGPTWVTQGPDGNLYVTDSGNNAIREMTFSKSEWIVTTIVGFLGKAGSIDGPSSQAQFYFPNGITADRAGNLFISDQDNHTIRKLSRVGGDWIASTLGGYPLISGSADGTGRNARFKRPWGIAVDTAGNLYIADSLNNTIRKGVPPSVPAPVLDLTLSGPQLVLRWPTSAVSFVLETSSTLDGTAAWTILTNDVQINGSSFVLTTTTGSSTAFYRLRKL